MLQRSVQDLEATAKKQGHTRINPVDDTVGSYEHRTPRITPETTPRMMAQSPGEFTHCGVKRQTQTQKDKKLKRTDKVHKPVWVHALVKSMLELNTCCTHSCFWLGVVIQQCNSDNKDDEWGDGRRHDERVKGFDDRIQEGSGDSTQGSTHTHIPGTAQQHKRVPNHKKRPCCHKRTYARPYTVLTGSK